MTFKMLSVSYTNCYRIIMRREKKAKKLKKGLRLEVVKNKNNIVKIINNNQRLCINIICKKINNKGNNNV
jgi:hypothetical protein